MDRHRQGSNIIANLPTVDVSFDVDAFDRLIRSHGVNFVHYRSMRCPIGLTDRGSLRTPNHTDHDCSNGYLYRRAGTVVGSFTGNSAGIDKTDIGLIDGSTVQVTFEKNYSDSGAPVAISPFDRFYLDETVATVINWQTVESSPTGRDKLQYPPVLVEDLIDSSGAEYRQDEDFVIDGGYISWVGSRKPPFDPRLGKGTIYSIRYQYIPFWYVAQLIREVRVTRVENRYTGERPLVRMPYAAVLKREIVFESEQNPTLAESGDLRDIPAPKATFGAR